MKRNAKLIRNKYLEFFIPTVLTAMATNFAAIVDGGIVGNLIDSTALSVVNILMPVVQLYASISVLFGIAASVIIASSRGKDGTDLQTGNRAYTVVLVLLAIVSAAAMAAGLSFSDGIVSLLSPVRELRPLVKEYYIPMILGTPVTLFLSSLVHVVRTDNRPKYATAIIVTANTVNLVLDVVLIRLFNLGLVGASLATVIGNAVGLGMVILHFCTKRCTVRGDVSVLRAPGLFFRYVRDVLANGASGAVGMMLTTGKLLFLNLMIQNYGGKEGMVAFSAVSMCQILESAFVAGGCMSMVPIVSLLYGEKDYAGIRTAFRTGLRILTVSCLVITATLEIFPQLAALIYGIGGTELPMAVTAIRLTVPMLLGDAVIFLFIYLYMCTENKSFSTVISIFNGIVLLIPTGILFAKAFGLNGIWMAMTVSQYAAFLPVLIGALILSSRRKTSRLFLLDEKSVCETLTFSVGEDGVDLQAVCLSVAQASDQKTADGVQEVLRILQTAPREPRRSKNTDVRVCREETGYSVRIKHSGARLCVGDFSALAKKFTSFSYSQAIGFSQIRF